MGRCRSRKAAGGQQVRLVGGGASKFFPTLKPSDRAVGKFIHVPGSYWSSCPAADKGKIYKCLVSEFVLVHDFGVFKQSGYRVCSPPPTADCARTERQCSTDLFRCCHM